MQTPVFTVVIPTYNREKLLKAALQSVINQTFPNWEAIVVDNFSTDDTDSMVNAFNDVRIKIVKVKFLGSVAASRNLAVNLARGKWIAFLDSDDFWDCGKLQTVNKSLDDSSDLLYHYVEIISEDLQKIRVHKSRRLRTPIYKDLLLGGNPLVTSSVVMRRNLYLDIGGMCEEPKLLGMEDYEMWLRVARTSERFTLIPKQLGSYRIHADSLSKKNNYVRLFTLFENHISSLAPNERYRLQSLYLYGETRRLFKEGHIFKGMRQLIFVIRHGKLEYILKSLTLFLLLPLMSLKVLIYKLFGK
jgi:glycosyltransferase involved in cell wall biosynthesis